MLTNDPYTDPELIEASYRAFNETLLAEVSLRTGFRPPSAAQVQLSGIGGGLAGSSAIGRYQGELELVVYLPERGDGGGGILD